MIQEKCPQCNTRNAVWPEDYRTALEKHFTQKEPGNQNELLSEATRITETWYRCEVLAPLLDYAGANLGKGAERELMPIVVQGLLEAGGKESTDNGK